MRKTLSSPAVVSGVGLHTGVPATMTFKPADNGITFLRTDIAGAKPIAAHVNSVSSTLRGTNLKNETAEVWTVEHALSALHALGITDAAVEMDGPEPPVTDGASDLYIEALQKAGLKELPAEQPLLNIKQKITYSSGNISYSAEPADKLTFTFLFLHKHPLVSRQEFTLEFTPENYIKEISRARTFGFEEELAFLKAHGLAKGGNLENAVIVGKDKFINELRYPDELVRHKILDLVGDLSLTGRKLPPLKITCACGGHKHNIIFAKILLANSEDK
ncbi:UDP-3-O-acyl-N-acetylglucosamine deacetylase [Candidatus Avelusimicrobium gallicola]|uniref:UDP-3-O-acyl-N-acetylglucosamine deacetylase n=1 Tax=Candidatus Avelusimicrobium gallicola TaxID=2562704 RepID=A0A1Y4DAK1_9BACT|nr:UDP-3-O-acyl-N-acetylglucosamine deacetylase [Elusimicrobium sp. An273]OUO56233.1 UDP-3-O-[3-hydroxymyristoyl] N-acetylglucosamine deacetylase [Elusimicrobium sp. An273]